MKNKFKTYFWIMSICAFFVLGIFSGIQIQNVNTMKMISSIQIEHLTIDFNETQIIDAMTNYVEEYKEELENTTYKDSYEG